MGQPLEDMDFVSQQALNILARQAARNAGRAVVLAGSYFLGREIQRRIRDCEVIWISSGGFCIPSNETYPLSKRGKLVGAGSDESGDRRVLILACPFGEGYDDRFSQSLVRLQVHRDLLVLAYGWLSRLRPEWQLLRTSLSSARWVGARIRRAGWVVDKEYWVGGFRSAAWGFLAKSWACLGRQDLADRCYCAMREGLVNTDGSAGSAVLVVTHAKRSLSGSPMVIHE